MRLRILLVLATLAVAGVSVSVAGAVSGGSQKFDLLGPDGNAFCDGSGVEAGAPGGYGFAVIKYDKSLNTVSATVSAKGLTPNATYNVELVQGNDDCLTDDASFTTNGQGKGSVSVSEASVSGHAFVFVYGAYPGALDSYTTETFTH